MRKTIFTLGLMLAAALSLTNCSKNEEVDFTPAPENTFELYANVESRTINDGMTTKWADGDQINVFHAVAGTTAYVNDTPYVEATDQGTPFVTDASGLFKGSLAETLDQTKSYDWYAIYPYSSRITTPANKTAGYVYIGGRSDTPQVQNGNNSTAHIAGKNYPLVGVAKAVPASDKPAITMSHISSLIEYNITNELAEDITVTSIEFSTVEDVVGTYYIDFTGETIKYTTGDYTSQTAVLTVNNGQAIKNGDNATFYMAIRPFSIDDDDITIKVNAKTATGVGTYTKTLATVTEFHAGQMKTINIGFNAKIEVSSDMTATIDFSTKDQRTSLSTTEQVWSNAGITLTNTKGSSTSDVADYSNPARFYKDSKIEITSAVGKMTKIDFKVDTDDAKYKTALTSSISNTTSNNDIVTVTFAEPTDSFNFTLSGGQTRFKNLTVTYTPADTNAPYIGLEKTSLDVSAAATSEEIAVTLTNINESDVTVNSDATWVVADLAEGVLTLNIAENTDTAARTATVTISAEGVVKTVTINQQGAATLETVTIAQFLEKTESTTAWYQLTGKITNIKDTNYGNLTIQDETGSIYVYGLKENATAGNQTFSKLGLKVGDIVTLIGNRGAYNGSPQVTNAYYVDHEIGTTPEPEPSETKTLPYTESFASSQGDFTINNVTLGTLSYVWQHSTYNSDGFMKASAYKGSAVAAESWLISPAISLASTTSPVVTFSHTHKFAGTPSQELTLWVSANDGDWEQVTIPTYGSNNDYTFVESGEISLAKYVGTTVKIAFKYVSTSSKAGTWEVKNFSVTDASAVTPEPEEPEEPEQGETKTATLSFASINNRTVLSTTQQVWEQNGVMLTNNKASSTSNVADYSSPARFYKSSDVIVSTELGNITSIKFSCSAGDYLIAGTTTNGSLTNSGTTVTVNLTTPADSFTIKTLSTQARVSMLTITYIPNGNTAKQPQTLSFPNSTYSVVENGTFEAPVLTGAMTNVTYKSSATSVATVDANTGAVTIKGVGTTVITATAETNETYSGASASYTLRVTPASVDTDGTYTLVTNISELVVGDKIVIAAKNSNFAMSKTQNTNNRGQVAITKSDNTIAINSSVQEFTVAAGTKENTFAFDTGSGYLYAASSSNNHLKTETTLTANSSWAISIATDGTATIEAQGSNTRKVMQYNQSNSLFACYGSASQQALVIYRLK